MGRKPTINRRIKEQGGGVMKNSSIIGRILAIFVLGFWTVLCLTAVANAAEEPKKNAPEPQQYQVELEKAMENYFNFLQALNLEKGLTKEEKEKKAIAYANKFRFGPEQKDYLILVKLDGTLVMDPYQPQLDGQNLLSWKDPNGQQPFKIMGEMMLLNPEGYMSYLWPKYGGEKPVPTVAFLKTYPPFGWFAGAVTPIKDIEAFSLFGYAGAFVNLIAVDIDNQGASSTGGN
jgi:methyl-accepting chemotaxis protein